MVAPVGEIRVCPPRLATSPLTVDAFTEVQIAANDRRVAGNGVPGVYGYRSEDTATSPVTSPWR